MTVLENRIFLEKIFSKKLHTQQNGPTGALKSHNAEKLKGDPLRFFNIHSVAKHEKIEENKNFYFREKISQCRKKTERGDPLVSPGMVCYAEKQEKPFWFSSLGQIVQFGAIILCRTFKNYFGQFVWIEKKESL